MKLTADGGSTKVHWVITEGTERVDEFQTPGLNPSVMTESELTARLGGDLARHVRVYDCEDVEYYGAGCRGTAMKAMERSLGALLPDARSVTVGSDMLGACRGVAPKGERSVVCILGTGANSCVYDGEQITTNVPPLGYILGDEGSGAWIGKRLLHGVLKGIYSEELREAFHERFAMDYDEIIRRVYRPDAMSGETSNGFLASLAPFASEHMGDAEIERTVREGIGGFFDSNVMLYEGCREMPVCFVGSVAAVFENIVRSEADKRGLHVGVIKQSPLAD